MQPDLVAKPLDKFLLFVVRYGLYAAFFLPFVVVLKYLYPWVSGKIWGFELIVELLFPLWVLLAMRRKEFRPAANAFTYAVLAWFAVITVSMLFGDDVHRSLWSKPDRLTGLFFQYHLLAFFLMAGTVWRGRLRPPIILTVGIASILSIQAILQAYAGVGGDSERGSATFGNPSYFGQYMVPHVFLALGLFWQDRARAMRGIWLGLTTLLLIGILASKSRGALLGLFLTVLVAALIAAFKSSGTLRRVARWSLFGAVLLVAGYFIADRVEPTHSWLYNQRLSVQYFRETSGPRQLLIANVLKGIKERPILGWGPENFESAFYYFYDPTTLRFSDYETRQDRPHNLILELLVDFGMIGLLAYGAIFFFGTRAALRSGEDRWMPGALLALGTLSQIATNLFIFETPMSYVMMYFQLAFLAAFLTPTVESGEDETSQGAVPAFLTAAGFAVWAAWYGVLGTISAAKLTANAIISLQGAAPQMQADDFRLLMAELKKTHTPYLERNFRAIASHLSVGRNDYLESEYTDVLRELAGWEWAYAEGRKNDYVFNLVAASSLASLKVRSAEEQAALEAAAARMQALSPDRQEVRWMSAQIAEEKGDLAAAARLYQEAVDLDQTIRTAQAHYAAFLIRAGRIDEAMLFLKDRMERIKTQGDSSYILSKSIVTLLDANRADHLIALYESSQRQGLAAFEWYMAGALGYLGTGEKDKGRAIAEEAKRLFPDKATLIDQNLGPLMSGGFAAPSAVPVP